MDKTIKLEILNDVGDSEHQLSNGDIVRYNLNGDMLYYYDDQYKTIETVDYADVGVPYQYKIEIYGQTFIYSFNDVPPFQLDELFDILKHKYIREAHAPAMKYHYPGYGGQTNHPIVVDWVKNTYEDLCLVEDINEDMANRLVYGRLTNHIDVSNWDFSNVATMCDIDMSLRDFNNVPSMRSGLDVGDDCYGGYGLDYGY